MWAGKQSSIGRAMAPAGRLSHNRLIWKVRLSWSPTDASAPGVSARHMPASTALGHNEIARGLRVALAKRDAYEAGGAAPGNLSVPSLAARWKKRSCAPNRPLFSPTYWYLRA